MAFWQFGGLMSLYLWCVWLAALTSWLAGQVGWLPSRWVGCANAWLVAVCVLLVIWAAWMSLGGLVPLCWHSALRTKPSCKPSAKRQQQITSDHLLSITKRRPATNHTTTARQFAASQLTLSNR